MYKPSCPEVTLACLLDWSGCTVAEWTTAIHDSSHTNMCSALSSLTGSSVTLYGGLWARCHLIGRATSPEHYDTYQQQHQAKSTVLRGIPGMNSFLRISQGGGKIKANDPLLDLKDFLLQCNSLAVLSCTDPLSPLEGAPVQQQLLFSPLICSPAYIDLIEMWQLVSSDVSFRCRLRVDLMSSYANIICTSQCFGPTLLVYTLVFDECAVRDV
ncbi:hypothetical protein ABVT39_005681 [Epinephelus coioides]